MKKKVQKWFKDVFGFSQTEINGFFILCVILLLLIVTPFFFHTSQGYTNFHKDQAALDSLLSSLSQTSLGEPATNASAKSGLQSAFNNSNTDKSPSPSYHPFDPNHVSLNGWIQMGVSEKIGLRIGHFLQSGGQFRIKADLKKIYGFPDDKYKSLASYITLPDSMHQWSKFARDKKRALRKTKRDSTSKSRMNINRYKARSITPFEINSCSKNELIQIHGIGEKLSERIIKFRDKLGGFYSKNQYREIYGLDSNVILQLEQYSTLTMDNIRKIDLNTCTKDTLAHHPYIDYHLADIIINFRTQHGPYPSIEGIQKIYVIQSKPDLYRKISPYLSVPLTD